MYITKNLINMKPCKGFFVAICLFLCTLVFGHGDEEFDGLLTVQLQHSFDPGPDFHFTDRGSISLRSMKSYKFNVQNGIELSDKDQIKLIELVNSNGFYRIRVPIKVNDSISYLSTFIRACSLYESGLSDVLTFHTGMNGELLGVSASTTQTLCEGSDVPENRLHVFNTAVEVRPMESGPIPDTAAFIQKVEKEKADRAKNEQGDNRSFFAKYWMYIVPAVVFMFISQIFSPDAQGGGNR